MRSRLVISAALVAGLIPAAALGSPSLTKRYKADLTPSAVIPKPGPAGGKGSAHFALNGSRFCWTIKVSGIGAPVGARIHSGGPFSNGPVVARLSRRYKPAGCTTISDEAVVAITACRCGDVYLDVQTRKFPKGALRGALEVSR
jgi:CHRD domain-containing protein